MHKTTVCNEGKKTEKERRSFQSLGFAFLLICCLSIIKTSCTTIAVMLMQESKLSKYEQVTFSWVAKLA